MSYSWRDSASICICLKLTQPPKPWCCSCRHSLSIKINVCEISQLLPVTLQILPPRLTAGLCWLGCGPHWGPQRAWLTDVMNRPQSCRHEASHCYLSSEPDSGEFGGDPLLKRWNMTSSLRLVAPLQPPAQNKAIHSLDSPTLNMTNDKGAPRAALWQHGDPEYQSRNYPANLRTKVACRTQPAAHLYSTYAVKL